MRRLLHILLLSLLCLPLPAQTYWTPEKLPMVHLSDKRRYVCNPDNVLSKATVDTLDRKLMRLEHDAGVQSVVVVVRHIEGDDPYAFGQALADRYGIGHKRRDDGLIVILCTDDRSYSILTGDGLEGVLPDAICRRIQLNIMVPLLKEGRWDKAMLATIDAIDGYIRNDEEMMQYLEKDNDNGGIVALLLTIVCIVIALAFISFTGRRRCHKCGKFSMRFVGERTLFVDGTRKLRKSYKCKNCGHITHEDTDIFPTGSGNMKGPFTGGGFGGSSFGGGFSGGFGGGFGGGSFGGGHFGGGGATGRF